MKIMNEKETKQEVENHKDYEGLKDRLHSSDCSDLDLQDEADLNEAIYE